MLERFVKLIPQSWKQVFKGTLGERNISRVRFLGWSRYCPVCQSWLRLFEPFGVILRPDARCPICASLERHRLVYIFFKQHNKLFDGSPKRMLHIAPEREFEVKFRQISNLDYLTGDLRDPRAMVKIDITDIQYPDDWFDVIYCSHVLEHVSDDRKAMREFNRVLQPNGWPVFVVPITAKSTFEDPSITDRAERKRLFGQHDHVRRYGPDFKDRLEQVGFHVRCFTAAEIVGEERIARLGVKRERVFFCKKEPPSLAHPPAA